MIKTNQEAFSNMISQYIEYSKNNGEAILEGRRYISTNDLDKRWLKLAKIIDCLPITPNLRLILIEYDNNNYVMIIGAELSTSTLDPSIILDEELNSGIATLLLSSGHLKLNRRTDFNKFYNDILFQHEEDGYEGHAYKEIEYFLEQVSFFSLPGNSIFLSNEDSVSSSDFIHKIACYLFSQNSSQLILDFDQDFLEKVLQISIENIDSISHSILLDCLFSTTYKHAFLELYRLIERLFSIGYLYDFHSKANTSLSFLEFSAELENITSWRPKEDSAIKKIFDSRSDSVISSFNNFMNSSELTKQKKHCNYFYLLRNSIVHFRANHLPQRLETEQWNLLLLATLSLVEEQYRKYNSIIMQKVV